MTFASRSGTVPFARPQNEHPLNSNGPEEQILQPPAGLVFQAGRHLPAAGRGLWAAGRNQRLHPVRFPGPHCSEVSWRVSDRSAQPGPCHYPFHLLEGSHYQGVTNVVSSYRAYRLGQGGDADGACPSRGSPPEHHGRRGECPLGCFPAAVHQPACKCSFPGRLPMGDGQPAFRLMEGDHIGQVP